MTTIKPFELTIRIRNNWIKGRRLALGMTQKQLAVSAGIGLDHMVAFERMAADHFTSRAALDAAIKLASFLGATVDQLFPPERDLVRQTTVVRQLDGSQVQAMAAVAARALLPEPIQNPEDAVVGAELAGAVHGALDSLTKRERLVIERRFGVGNGCGETLEMIAVDLGVSRERIRSIEARALIKLRRPCVSNRLKPFAEG